MYQIDFTFSASKELKGLPKNYQTKIIHKVEALKEIPRPHGVEKLKGSSNLYRIRIRDYRVVYEIDDSQKRLVVTRIRHRREVYR